MQSTILLLERLQVALHLLDSCQKPGKAVPLLMILPNSLLVLRYIWREPINTRDHPLNTPRIT